MRIIHLELGYPNPLSNNYMLDTVLKGVARCKGLSVNKKLPITPILLLKIKAQLNLGNLNDAVLLGCVLNIILYLVKKVKCRT